MNDKANGTSGPSHPIMMYEVPWAGPLPGPDGYDPVSLLREAFAESHPMLRQSTSFESMFPPADPNPDLLRTPMTHLSEGEYRRFARGIMADKASKALAEAFKLEQQQAANRLMGVYQDVADRLKLGPLDKLAPESCPVIDTETGCVFQRLPTPKAETVATSASAKT